MSRGATYASIQVWSAVDGYVGLPAETIDPTETSPTHALRLLDNGTYVPVQHFAHNGGRYFRGEGNLWFRLQDEGYQDSSTVRALQTVSSNILNIATNGLQFTAPIVINDGNDTDMIDLHGTFWTHWHLLNVYTI
jgi:hypothetical protein